MGRTNALVGPGSRLQLPWPRALGTPPWGAQRRAGGRARPHWDPLRVAAWCGSLGPAALRATTGSSCTSSAMGRPALLYVGNALAPRHVTLVLPGTR